MRLSELIDNSYIIGNYNDVDIKDLSLDSSKCRPGSIFFAIKGALRDGNDFIDQSVNNGAVAVVGERKSNHKVNYVSVRNAREVMAIAARRFYMNSSVDIAGITGTNGKTTTSYLIDSILKAAHIPSGIFGTIAYRDSKSSAPASITTPDPISFWKSIAQMKKNGTRFVVMEVSSHAITQKRIFGINFKEKIFTNLSQDHLDYYGTMENYEAAKISFFDKKTMAIINGDSETGRKIIKLCKNAITYGFEKTNFIHPVDLKFSKTSTVASIKIGKRIIDINSKLIGRYNLYNIMAALGFAYAEDIDMERAKKGIETLLTVAGRIEKISHNGIDIYIDYAHTPDALYNVGDCIKELGYGCIITVFGAGGNRDRTKRPMMAAAVETFSDTAIVTTDNPRKEEPVKIIEDILKGFKKDCYEVEVDRKKAIEIAIRKAKPGDAVLIAGKGHETYQIIGDKKYYFSDKAVVRKVISEL